VKKVIVPVFRIIALGAMLAAVTLLVYYSGGAQGASAHFYYLPIIISAFWFGDLGAILVAVLAAFLCGPYMPENVQAAKEQGLEDILVRTCFFYVVGVVTSSLSGRLARRAREFATLFEVASAVSSSLKLGEVLSTIVNRVVGIMGLKGAIIRLLKENNSLLPLGASHGLSQKYLDKGDITLEESPLDRRLISTGSVHVIDVAKTDELQYPGAAQEEGIRSIIALPLAPKEKTVGVMRLYSSSRRKFSPEEIELIRTFANQAAVAVENATLYENIKRGYYDTVRALTLAIEAKDPPTLGHSERVTDLLLQMGARLKLPEETLEVLGFAGILHDIGKLGSPEAGGDEPAGSRLIYELHPLVGRAILSPVRFLKPLLPMIQHHHERLDGSGFPEGLRDDAISWEGRILAVVDAYDILVSGMDSHQPPLSERDALRQITEGRGKLFDPELVDVLAALLAEQQIMP